MKRKIRRQVLWSGLWAAALCLLFPAVGAAEEYYICAGGETTAQIAAETGVTEPLLLAANDLAGPGALTGGQLLCIPADLVFTVTVEPGDTFYALAERYGVPLEELLARNPVSPRRLRVGMELAIPLGEETAAIRSAQAVPALAALAPQSDRLLSPVEAVVSSGFGPRWGSFHYGLDLAADRETPILAAASGLVTEADWKSDGYGYAVMIDHGNGLETLYGHCAELLVEPGQRVRAGDPVALVGSTGHATGPHVHFEVRINGECQDPLDYL